MLLSHETAIRLDTASENIIGHMCYAASKLWNVCNYERNNYKELGLTKYPDWYYQKSVHKDNMWYKFLPSQTAQEVCKLLDKSWKSFYRLQSASIHRLRSGEARLRNRYITQLSYIRTRDRIYE